jgi:hypothetical protein
MKTHPHTNHLVSGLYQKCCGNGGIYTPGKCNQYALRMRRLWLRKPPIRKTV